MNDAVLTVEPVNLRRLFGLPPEAKPPTGPQRQVRRPLQIDWTLQQRQFFQNKMP